jgi:hypothetical protein
VAVVVVGVGVGVVGVGVGKPLVTENVGFGVVVVGVGVIVGGVYVGDGAGTSPFVSIICSVAICRFGSPAR